MVLETAGFVVVDLSVFDFVSFDGVALLGKDDLRVVFFAADFLAAVAAVFFDLAVDVEAVLTFAVVRFALLERDFRCSGLLVRGF